MKKAFIITILIILALGAGIVSFLYWGVYDEGVRAGVVLRISKKGVFWKTYEGQLTLESFGALKNVSPFAETFDFSVERQHDSIVKQLEQVSLSGQRVNLRYIKRYVAFPWRGKTKYYIIGVEKGPSSLHKPDTSGSFPH